MTCKQCGYTAAEGSIFCMNCGAKLEAEAPAQVEEQTAAIQAEEQTMPVQEDKKATQPSVPTGPSVQLQPDLAPPITASGDQATVAAAQPYTVPEQLIQNQPQIPYQAPVIQSYQPYSATPLAPAYQQPIAPYQNSESEKAKKSGVGKLIAIIALGVACLGLAVFSAVMSAQNSSRGRTVDQLEAKVLDRDETIESLESDLQEAYDTIDGLYDKAEDYDTITQFALSDDVGFGSYSFKADEGIIYISSYEEMTSFTLTSNYGKMANISLSTEAPPTFSSTRSTPAQPLRPSQMTCPMTASACLSSSPNKD